MDVQSTLSHAQLPTHGPIACRKCFSNAEPVIDEGPWRAVNDPGAWGSHSPEVLVLGVTGCGEAVAAFVGRDAIGGLLDGVP